MFLFLASLLNAAPGDVDQNGVIDAADTTLIINHVLGFSPLTGQALIDADLTLDMVVDVADILAMGAFTEPETVEANGILMLPAGLDPSTFEVGNQFGETVPNANGEFTLPVLAEGVTVTSAVPATYIDEQNAWLSVVCLPAGAGGANPADPLIVIDAASTAQALVLLHPFFLHSDPFRLQAAIDALALSSELQMFANDVEARFQIDPFPFNDPMFTAFYQNAVDALIAALPEAVTFSSGEVLSSAQARSAEIQPSVVLRSEAPRIQANRLDRIIQTDLESISVDTLKISTGLGQPLDSLVFLQEVDLEATHHLIGPDGSNPFTLKTLAELLAQENAPPEFPLYTTIGPRSGIVPIPANSLFKYLNVFGLIAGSISGFVGGGTGEIPFHLEDNRAYILRALAGRISDGADPWEVDFAWDNYDDVFIDAVALNLLNASFEFLQVVIRIGGLIPACAPGVYNALQRKIVQSLAGQSITDLSFVSLTLLFANLVKTAIGRLLVCVTSKLKDNVKQFSGNPGAALRNTLSGVFEFFNITGRVSDLGVMWDRVNTMIGLGLTPSLAPLFGSPMDSALILVGDPFGPRIIGVAVDDGDLVTDPAQPMLDIAKIGQQIEIRGQRLRRFDADPLPDLFARDAAGRLVKLPVTEENFLDDVQPATDPPTQSVTILESEGGIPKGLVGSLGIIALTPASRGESELLFDLQPDLFSLSPANVFPSVINTRVSLVGNAFRPPENVFGQAIHEVVLGPPGMQEIIRPLSFLSGNEKLVFAVPPAIAPGRKEVGVRWRESTPDARGAPELFLRVLGPPSVTGIDPGEVGSFQTFRVDGLNFGEDVDEVKVIFEWMRNGMARDLEFKPQLIISSDSTDDAQTAQLFVRAIPYDDPEDSTPESEPLVAQVRIRTPEGESPVSEMMTITITPETAPIKLRTILMPFVPTGTAVGYANQGPTAPSGVVTFQGPCDTQIGCTPNPGDPAIQISVGRCRIGIPDSYFPDTAPNGDTTQRGVTPPGGVAGIIGPICSDVVGCGLKRAECAMIEGDQSWEPFTALEIQDTLKFEATAEMSEDLNLAEWGVLRGPEVNISLISNEFGRVVGGGMIIEGDGKFGSPRMINTIGRMDVHEATGVVITIRNAKHVNLEVGITGAAAPPGSIRLPASIGIVIEDSSFVNIQGFIDNCATGILIKNSENVSFSGAVSGYTDAGIVIDGGRFNIIESPRVGFRQTTPGSDVAVVIPAGQVNGIILKGGTNSNVINRANIVGNSANGIWIQDATKNTINPLAIGALALNNFPGSDIVTDPEGPGVEQPSRNAVGIRVSAGAVDNLIDGGASSTQLKIIGPNDTGILLEGGEDTRITRTWFGINNRPQDPDDIRPGTWTTPGGGLGNGTGIKITGTAKNTIVADNFIGFSTEFGLEVDGAQEPQTIMENEFGAERGGFSFLLNGPNGMAGIHVANGSRRADFTDNDFFGESISVWIEDSSDLDFKLNRVMLLPPGGVGFQVERSHTIHFDVDRVCGGAIDFTNGVCDLATQGGATGFHFIQSGAILMNRVFVERVDGDGIEIEGPALLGRIRIEGLLEAGSVIVNTENREHFFDGLLDPPDGRLDSSRAVVVFANTDHGIHAHSGASDVELVGVNVLGNGQHGVYFDGVGAGMRLEESRVVENKGHGVLIENSDTGFIAVGSRRRGSLIGDNDGGGVVVRASSHVIIQGNFIVFNGIRAANADGGIQLEGADQITVGGNDPNEGNLLSGNSEDGLKIVNPPAVVGAPRYAIEGNFIGTTSDGKAAIANTRYGISLDAGPAPGRGEVDFAAASNLISANAMGGVMFKNTDGNQGLSLSGNIIGRWIEDPAIGVIGVANGGSGVMFHNVSFATLIGNRIGFNLGNGIELDVSGGNFFRANTIVSQTKGGLGFFNRSNGNSATLNIIRDNATTGIAVTDLSLVNFLSRNSITSHPGSGILLFGGGNEHILAPVIDILAVRSNGTRTIRGRTAESVEDGALIELFMDEDDEGRVFLGDTDLLANRFSFNDIAPPAGETFDGKVFHVTVTDFFNNTSEFGSFDPSNPLCRPTPIRNTDLATPGPGLNLTVASRRDGNIVFTNVADGSTSEGLLASVALDSDPSVAHAGAMTLVAFTSERDGDPEIYISTDFAAPVRLTDRAGQDIEPSLSPDGSKVAFVTDRDGDREVYVMDADGLNVTRLTADASDDRQPDWSPDGTMIVFSSNRGGTYQIYTMSAADGSGVAQRTSFTGDAREPAWRKLTNMIAYEACTAPGACRIGTVDLSTGVETLISSGCWSDEQPNWAIANDGSAYLVTSSRPNDAEPYHLYLMTLQGNILWQISPEASEDRDPSVAW